MAVYSLRIKTIWYQNGSVYKLRHEDYKIAPCIWDMPRIADNLCLENHPNFHNDNLDNLDFSLGICSSPFSANEVILGITRFAPRVKELYWFGDTIFAPWQVKGPDIRTLSSLSKLHALNVRVAPDALWAVGTLPHLRQLEVRLDFFETEWNEWDAFPHGRAAGLFPTLTQLKVKAAGPLGTIALMETITSSSLAQLAISITQQIAPELLLGVLCSSLSSSPFQQALRSLILVVDTGGLFPFEPNDPYPTTPKCCSLSCVYHNCKRCASDRTSRLRSSTTPSYRRCRARGRKSESSDSASLTPSGTGPIFTERIHALAPRTVLRRRLQASFPSPCIAHTWRNSRSRSICASPQNPSSRHAADPLR
ncbi:hypothetical protein C8Q70DRAFT_93460 [Cubamyces menziesii]|nr:hypothetical protein C8Q70DRAFT_93460 [Cubamyces menziesii]